MKNKKVSVIGAGAWGTAIANHLATIGHDTLIWAYEKDVVADINANHTNSLFLNGVALHHHLKATSNLADAASRPFVFFAVPSHVMQGIVEQMVPHLVDDVIVVSVTKGIENEGLRLPSQIFNEYLPEHISKRKVCFSGPSFAREVAAGLPTGITAASATAEAAEEVQKLMSSARMRVYTNSDVIGVELGGVVKNVIAIAAGISDGMELGHNARAAIITRGLEEAVRLGVAMGADEKTFRGLSGIGDLVLTASGDLSRNRTVGLRLGRGETLTAITDGMQMVAEGIRTSLSIHQLSEKMGVYMPICREVYRICYEGKETSKAMDDLLSHDPQEEFSKEEQDG